MSDRGRVTSTDSACSPANARYPVKGWPRIVYRVAWKTRPLERLPLQHRPGPPHTMPTRSRGLGPEVTPKGLKAPASSA